VVRLISPLVLLICLAACQRGQNTSDAVRQGVIDHLVEQKFDVAAMDVKVATVRFQGSEAVADVQVTLKNKGDSPPMNIRYQLENQKNKWVVTGLDQGNGHGGAADPNAAGANPHGGAMPPGADNPHGGAMPPAGGAGNMPSPEDLPPVTKK
jgi:galactitol-specific phosphotransferase system IIB component